MHENMFRQQLESLFIIPSISTPIPKLAPTPKRSTLILALRPYLHDMIDNLRTSDKWKINLLMKMKFIPSNDDDESQPIHSKGN